MTVESFFLFSCSGGESNPNSAPVMCPPGLPQDDSRDDGPGPADLGQVRPDGESSAVEHSITKWIKIFSTYNMRSKDVSYTREQFSFLSEVFTPALQPILY